MQKENLRITVKHNVIFIGYDPKGTVRYAGIRGTKEKYRGDAPGSEKAYGFSHTVQMIRYLSLKHQSICFLS
ncbi:MAG: DUF3991 domain-containing protein [Mediterraneibacter gnavus]